MNTEKLKRNDDAGRQAFQRDVEQELTRSKSCTLDGKWNDLKRAVVESATKNLGFRNGKVAKKPWVTATMIAKMDERKQWKSVNTDQGKERYRKLNNELRRETDRAREVWWEEQCAELGELDKKGKMDLLYNKVKFLAGIKRHGGGKNRGIKDEEGRLITESEEIKSRWGRYVMELYDADGRPVDSELEQEEDCTVDEDSRGPDILKEEVIRALKDMKLNKAEGVDGISAEMWKAIGDAGERYLIELSQEMYKVGTWPKEFAKTIMIPIAKKSNATDCGDYRTISLIPHVSKIMLKILQKRIEGKVEDYISKTQYGFRRGVGTRDAIGVVRLLSEKSIEFDKEIYVCFVDFEKAFDRVDWVKMMDILKKVGVDWRDRKLISELYRKQQVVVRVNDDHTEPTLIGRGVRQGCLLSPLLFLLYSEAMMADAMQDLEDGVVVGGTRMQDVRFADDQAMLAGTNDGLQRIMDRLHETAKEYGMKINVKKTKVMKISRDGGGQVILVLDGKKIEQVKQFKYLGAWITEDGRSDVEVKTRIALAKEAFSRRKELLSRRMRLDLRKKIIKTVIWSVLLYGAETWILKKQQIKRIEAFEMWIWRRMERISWTEHVSNERVLERVGEMRTLIETIIRRKKTWIGHVVRGDGLLKDVIEGRMEGKRTRGRKRVGMLDDLFEAGSYGDMKRRAENREIWRSWMPRTC